MEADDEEEEIEVETEEDIKVVIAHDTVEGESQGVTTEESVEEAKVDSDEEAEVGSDSSDVTSSVFVLSKHKSNQNLGELSFKGFAMASFTYFSRNWAERSHLFSYSLGTRKERYTPISLT